MGEPEISDDSEFRNTTDPTMWKTDEAIQQKRAEEARERERKEAEARELRS